MKQIEQTISSIEVAEMVGKAHNKLMRDIRDYIEQLAQSKIGHGEFFQESSYKDANNQTRPCYNVTKKGCEFIAHKLTGVKGTEFTAKYIDRFHDMEDTIRQGIQQKDRSSHKEKLPSVNQMVKNIKGALRDAGVDAKYIAAEVVRIYSDNGYPVKVPLISDVPVLWDCTTIAKELGIYSESGRPHDKAVSAIIQKLSVSESEIVKTVYSRNGHDGVTVQYKDSVLRKIKLWLKENGYPTLVEERNIKDVLNQHGWNYAGSYQASRVFLEDVRKTYPSLKYFVDVHRDSLGKDRTTVTIDNKNYASILFLIGLENPNYQENLEFTEKISQKINEKYPNLSKGIYQKEGPGVNGVYNQDFSPFTILVEMGGPENTIDEVLNTSLAFADCFLEVIREYEIR